MFCNQGADVSIQCGCYAHSNQVKSTAHLLCEPEPRSSCVCMRVAILVKHFGKNVQPDLLSKAMGNWDPNLAFGYALVLFMLESSRAFARSRSSHSNSEARRRTDEKRLQLRKRDVIYFVCTCREVFCARQQIVNRLQLAGQSQVYSDCTMVLY